MKKLKGISCILIMLVSIINISFADTYSEIFKAIDKYSVKYTIERELIMAVIEQESSWKADAYNEDSGCVGLMQLLPSTAEWMGYYNWNTIDGNVGAGTAYIRYLLNYYNGNLKYALAAYNYGPTAFDRCGRNISKTPAETRNYVPSVINHYNRYKNGSGTSIPASGVQNSNICKTCKGVIGYAWYTTSDGKHYRLCENNHINNDDFHNWDEKLVCRDCTINVGNMSLNVGTPFSGNSMIININNINIKKEDVEKVIINVKGKQYLIYEENITKLPVQYGEMRTPYKEIITQNGTQIQIMDERVAIVIPRGSEESKILGDGKTKNTLDIYIYTTSMVYRDNAVINGNELISTELMVETNISGNSLIIDMDNSGINKDNVDWIQVTANEKMLIWEGNILELSKKKGDMDFLYKEMFTDNGSQVLVADGRVSVVIPQGTLESRILGSGEMKNIEIEIGCIDGVVTGETQITGIELPTEMIYQSSNETVIEPSTGNSNEQIEIPEKYTFVDYTDPSHWAWENINRLYDLGIVKGTYDQSTGKKFLNPAANITAEECIALVARILGYNGLDEIKDNSVYNPFGKNIEKLWSRGEWKFLMKKMGEVGRNPEQEMKKLFIINGGSVVDGYKQPITREQLGYILGMIFVNDFSKADYKVEEARFADWNLVEGNFKYRLSIISDPNNYNILRGVLDGSGALYINPKNNITRVEAFTMIDRTYNFLH